MTVFSAALLLFLVMDPFGNIPFFITALKNVDPRRHKKVKEKKIPSRLTTLTTWIFLCLGVIFLLSPTIKAGENSIVPGRQVTFQKVLQIAEKEENFYFRNPTGIYVDMKENIYILDKYRGHHRILKFTKDGEFEGSLVRKGQGPGEVTYISNFCLADHDKIMIIHNGYPAKIIWKDTTGKLLKEFRLFKFKFREFIHYYNDIYYFFHGDIPVIKSKQRIMDVDHHLCAVTAEGKTGTKIHSFPIKKYIIMGEDGARASLPMGWLHYTIGGDRYLFVSHTNEYSIKCFDFLRKKIINEFKVNYEKQKIPAALSERFNRAKVGMGDKVIRPPLRRYFNDIQKLLIHNRDLWVVTSTIDKNKGVRIDVFNFNGDHTDSFFLCLPGREDLYSFNWCISGGYLYSIEKTEEDDPIILKYKIKL